MTERSCRQSEVPILLAKFTEETEENKEELSGYCLQPTFQI
jgi:hypothetical protein